ncbi:MAG: hypothetical protein ABJA37_00790 [Ferruginibacter sp.]
MRQSFFFIFVLFNCIVSCKAQPYTRIITLIKAVDDKGQARGIEDTVSIEYLNASGNTNKKVTTRRSESRCMIKTTFYDFNNKLISQITDYGNDLIVHTDNKRDSNGFIIESKTYDSKASDTSWYDFINYYNATSNILLSTMIDRENNLSVARYRLKYDLNKNILEDTELDTLGNEITKSLYEYTKSGKLLKQTYYEKAELKSSTQYTYTGDIKVEAIQSDASGLKLAKVRFVYK